MLKMSRGQVRTSQDGKMVDSYALGVTLFAMLAGRHPPEGEEITELTFRGVFWQRVSAEARDMILGLMEPDPDRRLSLSEVLEHPWLQPRQEVDTASALADDWAEQEVLHFVGGARAAAASAAAAARRGPAEPVAAFPEAPASSSAARIPFTRDYGTSTGASPGAAPGWGNVFSWLRADAAAAAARDVLARAGRPRGHRSPLTE
ncbi:unnamed protein product [Prorocentrum cordatum]|uniref:Protein kinase domain-containing protein n=1 Tax=Prorocentrum cordatum TaxID=2364126 RepID=A0ABN9XHW2_9DINO|nr:unnamed protein product [Polarella glacialis]